MVTHQATLEEVARQTTTWVLRSMLSDDAWRLFGYRRRPRYGSMFTFLRTRKQLDKEYFLSRELALIPLVQYARSMHDGLRQDYAVACLARSLELLVDGTGEHPFWEAPGFPSRSAAVIYYSTRLSEYLKAGSPGQIRVFAKQLMQVVDEKASPRFLAGGAQIFGCIVPEFYREHSEYLDSLCIVGEARLRDCAFLDDATEALESIGEVANLPQH